MDATAKPTTPRPSAERQLRLCRDQLAAEKARADAAEREAAALRALVETMTERLQQIEDSTELE